MAKQEQQGLWVAFRSGEEEAFSQLFFDYYELLYHYGCRIIPNEPLIKDVLQDFFLDLLETRAKLSPNVCSISAYLIASFRRRLMRELKSNPMKLYPLHETHLTGSHLFELGMEDIIIKKETEEFNKGLVSRLLQELPPRQREIIYLKYYLDLSLPEIAETLSISYQVVANHLYRATKKLQASERINFRQAISYHLKR